MQKTRLKWIWFDLDDTLHDFGVASKKAMADVFGLLSSETGLPLTEVQQNYREALQRQSVFEFADGRTSHEYRSERFLGAIGQTAPGDEFTRGLIEEALSNYEKNYMESLQLKPFALKTLQALKEEGFSLAILTDAPEDAQDRVIKKLGIEAYFDSIFTSGGMRASKRTGLYSKVIERLDVQQEQVVMIGNSLASDVVPALAAGIEAIWFNDIKASNEKAYREIQSLDALVGELSRIAGSEENGATD